jgi:ABC-type Na+ efflux pump permease subunit
MTAPAPAARPGRSVVFLVARREVGMRLRSRAFRIGTVLLVALIVVGVAAALSLLPPFAPILMPARLATSDVPVWQVLSAMGLVLSTTIGLTALAGRIYANSILRTGRRVALRDALRASPAGGHTDDPTTERAS